jgi:hypothetical protein
MTPHSTTIDKPVVIDPEMLAKKQISRRAHFVFQCDLEAQTTGLNTFLILQISMLNKHAQLLINAIRELKKLRVVFLLKDHLDKEKLGMDRFFDYLKDQDNSIRNQIIDVLHFPASVEQIGRMMHAWCDGSENLFIARAHVSDNELTLTSYGLKDFKVNFDAMPSLASIPVEQRNHFHLLEDGRRIEWMDGRISVDLDDVRYRIDPRFRRQENMRALNQYGLCGEAIKRLRNGMTRAEIEKRGGPSIKQLGRIESSPEAPSLNMLAKLAKAYKVSTKEYIKQLLKACDSIESEKIRALRSKKSKTL